MKITDTIMARRSVRTYNGEALDEAVARRITDYIATLTPPLGASCRIELVRTAATAEPVKLGTYGSIRGAADYLALIVRGKDDDIGAAWMFEQVILHCTALGLGTCWLVGFFDRGGFKKQLSLAPGERLRAVSPVGKAADHPHRSLVTMLNGGRPTPRKPFGEIFFNGIFGSPLTETAAGRWALPLEMVRRGPSANNRQTWRVVLSHCENSAPAGVLHFYNVSSGGYESLNAGIALCHFSETCRAEGIPGRLEVLPDVLPAPNASYVISCV
jgi:nitroreductase